MPRGPVVHPDHLSAVGGVLAGTRPTCVKIERYTDVSNSKGGRTKTWATLDGDVQARIAKLGGGEGGSRTERDAGGRIAGPQAWTIALPCGQDVTAKDRVVTVDEPTRTFLVSEVLTSPSYDAEVRVLAVEGS